MVTLTINGQTVQVPAGTTILEAAEKAGIKIPTLCYLCLLYTSDAATISRV